MQTVEFGGGAQLRTDTPGGVERGGMSPVGFVGARQDPDDAERAPSGAGVLVELSQQRPVRAVQRTHQGADGVRRPRPPVRVAKRAGAPGAMV